MLSCLELHVLERVGYTAQQLPSVHQAALKALQSALPGADNKAADSHANQQLYAVSSNPDTWELAAAFLERARASADGAVPFVSDAVLHMRWASQRRWSSAT
jgi:hypothetical protein